jgi:hypothetical protein
MSYTEALGTHFSKLDKEEIKDVGRSWAGKLLGRTSGLISLVAIGLSFGIDVDQRLRQLLRVDWAPTPWLLGLLFLVVVVQLAVEQFAKRNRAAAQRLAVRVVGIEQSGYFRIGPYLDTAEDRVQFKRADRAHEKVLNWIERSTSVPLYLTGDSGSGKTSLLNASVLPTLREHGWTVVEARAWQDAEAALRNGLAQLTGIRRPRPGEDQQEIRRLVEAAARRASARLLFVIDQFEEFLILGKSEQQQGFANLLSDLQAVPVRGLSLLLVLRSDYQTFLDDMGLPSLRQGDNFYQLARFRKAAASDFFKNSGLQLQPASVDHLLTSAAELDETPDLVRPITLNVIGYVLAAGKEVAPSLDAGQLVRRYIEQTVGQPAIRDFAPPVLEQLVTEQGTKQPRSEDEIAGLAHLRRGEVRAVLNGLGDAALARPLDPAQGVWELSHDFIARAVARYLGRGRHHLWQRSAFYAAPVLLTAMALLAAGVFLWNWVSPYQIRSELTDLGLTIKDNGMFVTANPPEIKLTRENFAKTGPLLARLTTIRSLDLSGKAEVENLEPIQGLTGLQMLILRGTRVTEFQSLKDLTGLQSLDLSGTAFDNLEPLKSLSQLHWLYLNHTNVWELRPLRLFAALWLLDLSETSAEKFEGLEGLTALLWLDLHQTKIKNLQPLHSLTALRALHLGWTNVPDLRPLQDLTKLQCLYMSAGTVTEDKKNEFIRYRQEHGLPSVEIRQVESGDIERCGFRE